MSKTTIEEKVEEFKSKYQKQENIHSHVEKVDATIEELTDFLRTALTTQKEELVRGIETLKVDWRPYQDSQEKAEMIQAVYDEFIKPALLKALTPLQD